MKVRKFEKKEDPGYPSHRQFTECKALLGIAALGLGSVMLNGCKPRPQGAIRPAGTTIRPSAESPAPTQDPPSASSPWANEPPPRLDGYMIVEPRPSFLAEEKIKFELRQEVPVNALTRLPLLPEIIITPPPLENAATSPF